VALARWSTREARILLNSRIMEGDTVVINLHNNMDGNIEPHNIDLHAAMGPGEGAAVTEIEPGETATLRFKALREGAYIYHCAAEGMAWEHVFRLLQHI
jgi:nitrite reductase (NO-forming)